MHKKILTLVRNGFTNDARVEKTLTSLTEFGCKATLLAEKNHIGQSILQRCRYTVIRIPLLSSIYNKRGSVSTKPHLAKKKSHHRFLQAVKKNKIRIWFVVSINSIIYNFSAYFLGIIKQPNIVYSNDLDTLAVGYLISRTINAKLVYDSHEIWLEGNRFNDADKLKKLFWIYLEKFVITKCDFVITTTEMRAKYLEEKYKISNVQIIRNCPNYHDVKYHDLFRQEYTIPEDTKILLYQGLINVKRGVITFVNVVEKIPAVVLIIMGEGKHTNLLKEHIENKNLQHKVFLKDMVPNDQLLNYTSSADIGLQLIKNTCFNHYSAISNKIFEYIMSGIAIIASDFPEIIRIVQENNVGEVVNPDIESDIIDKIETILSEGMLEIFKGNSRKIRKELSWENEEKTLFKIINEL